jgi:hypothetical protein
MDGSTASAGSFVRMIDRVRSFPDPGAAKKKCHLEKSLYNPGHTFTKFGLLTSSDHDSDESPPYLPFYRSTMRNPRVTTGQRIPTTDRVANLPLPVSTPAVPMTIYRELAADLQATQANVTVLTHENQQLTEQNLLLRQELERIARQTQKTMQRLEIEPPLTHHLPDYVDPVRLPQASRKVKVTPGDREAQPLLLEHLYDLPDYPRDEPFLPTIDGASFGQVFQPRPSRPRAMPSASRLVNRFADQGFNLKQLQQSWQASELTGWKLTLVMSLIILSAFGAGFLVVRPLLSPNSTSNSLPSAPSNFPSSNIPGGIR